MGLSDQAQAILVLISLLLISVGALAATVPSQIPSPLNQEIGLALMILGAMGMALKEWLGIQTPAQKAAANA